MNNWLVAIDDRHVGIGKFDSFGVNNFFNVKKFFKAIISKRSRILAYIRRVLD